MRFFYLASLKLHVETVFVSSERLIIMRGGDLDGGKEKSGKEKASREEKSSKEKDSKEESSEEEKVTPPFLPLTVLEGIVPPARCSFIYSIEIPAVCNARFLRSLATRFAF